MLPSGALAVADTGNHRVQVFAETTASLLQVFGDSDSFGRPVAGPALGQFDRPSDVAADARGRLYVADRGNGRIVRISADGASMREVGAGFFRAPVRIAAGPPGVVVVIDAANDTAMLITPDRALPRLLPVAGASSAAFGSEGALFVGDRTGAIHTFARSEGSFRYERVGTAPTGVARPIVALAAYGVSERLALIVEGDVDGVEDTDVLRTLWQVETAGGFALSGTFVSERIDSERERHSWQRVRVQADVPPGTSIRIESATSDDEKDEPGEGSALVWTRCPRWPARRSRLPRAERAGALSLAAADAGVQRAAGTCAQKHRRLARRRGLPASTCPTCFRKMRRAAASSPGSSPSLKVNSRSSTHS